MVISRSLKSKKPPVKATVRRSQLISTYGVGSILPVESESFIVAGLDYWKPTAADEIEEPRLCGLLGVTRLYSPPGGEGAGMVPIARFPEWVYCPSCARLDKFWRLADKMETRYINKCRHCITARLVPSRFVACCTNCHIQDFPYRYWVHRGKADIADSDHSLRIDTDATDSTLAGITIRCSCGQFRTLEGALGSNSLRMRCGGASPWLDGDRVDCDEQLVGLQRGASNVWFADVRSALTVDRTQTDIERVLERIAPELSEISEVDVVVMLGVRARQYHVDEQELIDAYRKYHDAPQSYEDAAKQLRADEYEALGRSHPEVDGTETFVCEPSFMGVDDTADSRIELVSRVTRLREVRALRGFARVSTVNESVATSPGSLARKRTNWLPAVEVLGEGVFIRLGETAITHWQQTQFARDRAETLTQAMQAAAPERVGLVSPVSPRFLLLHSLSHALLNELALDTGYPASSIRERVYADKGQAGVLLYTATADAAGSLGGLCSHGTIDNVLRLFESATERAQWCSADPVCLESMSTGAGAANLAACHSCLLVPEVSCEHQNKLLDRACLVGREADPHDGFLAISAAR
ncbi:DUF1998 domain-containing protein [Rhodococcus sp. BP-349]|uniref:DUF1998 domain-containing protein n=1 Tax=unclassified Rhodococcus (in: high G+C Gram-positive bacteria) TaxID=192944 RepID=UPI001C9AC094|nr:MULTISPECIES: DUF1998 domain-containing protein [unclassified Rhodococcus (in: high G+C Gram-positive bacteria)]MBY6540050.1 DUF1998 domain-containing protein [Rhodococcus sp. BP-363]MBY6543622.1 DUF1998 domain-containing protein [Rhodococcus sp. BP-369]MBY6562852.1 DUF1998 domain-containing protein [Rhodococcus sp. BP-370]MBY6577144.1 DUF1998 domain-containing protein [Rhodococcus sp. BP-364]MBY6586445.1 DUF1998 domain-containing protein [Rhodococcus sp. BP-358]